jgi:hypothetical protein
MLSCHLAERSPLLQVELQYAAFGIFSVFSLLPLPLMEIALFFRRSVASISSVTQRHTQKLSR